MERKVLANSSSFLTAINAQSSLKKLCCCCCSSSSSSSWRENVIEVTKFVPNGAKSIKNGTKNAALYFLVAYHGHMWPFAA